MLALGHSELIAQHQNLGILPPRLSRRDKPGSDTARATIRKTSLKPASRRSSHAQQGQDLPATCQAQGRVAHIGGRICPGGTGFRHPQGCNAYRFSQDVADPAVLVLAEEWASEDALQTHLASPGFADFAKVFAEAIEGTPEFVRFDAAAGRPLFG
jgi:quinol monooxygenase YgiN